MSDREAPVKRERRLSPIAWLFLAIPAVVVGYFSTSPAYTFRSPESSALVVSFRYTTSKEHICSDEEIASMKKDRKDAGKPKHMQMAKMVCGSRNRVPLHIKVEIDDKVFLDEELSPSGLRNDSACYIYRFFLLPKGEHKISAAMSEVGAEKGEISYSLDKVVEFPAGRRVVIDYDSVAEKLITAE